MGSIDTASLPATMRGVFLPGDSTAVVKDVPVPTPGHGQLLLRVGASGICGSDIGYIYREHKTHKGIEGPAYLGVVAGHEPAGTVIQLGAGCRRFKVGDRVLVYHIAGCGQCENCRRGQFISCAEPARQAYGWQRDGGHAEYLLADESTCIGLPDELSFVDGALIACGFGTAYEGLRRVDVSGADDLLVVGLGPVGLAAATLGRGLGARRIIGVELNPTRRAWADDLGLFDTVLDAAQDPVDQVQQLTGGRGCSTAIDCSGAEPGRRVAIDAIAEWGRISLVGEGGILNTEVSDPLLHKQVTIYASWVTSLWAMEELTRNLVRWGLSPERIVSDSFGLEEADAAYAMAAGDSRGKVVIVPADR
jgi:threonine dehydrogenase-like Zn-dependent dehydrogenase